MTIALNVLKVATLLIGTLAVWAIAMPNDLPQALVDSSGSAVAAGFVEMVVVLALGQAQRGSIRDAMAVPANGTGEQ